MSTSCISSSITSVCLCPMCRRSVNSVCRMTPLEKNNARLILQNYSICRPISRSKNSSKINIFSFSLFLLVFVSFVSTGNADYLCGSRLVDALRYICGKRGIYNPAHSNRHRGSSHRRHPAQPQVSITHLCCELGCTFKQLKGYCAPAGHNHSPRPHTHQRHHFPTPPAFVNAPTTTLLQKITSTRRHSESTTVAPSSEPTTVLHREIGGRKRLSLQQLQNRYKFLIKNENNKEDKNATTHSSIQRLQEIIKVAAAISRRRDGDVPEIITDTDQAVEVTFIQDTRREH